jgi:hypothetical protein
MHKDTRKLRGIRAVNTDRTVREDYCDTTLTQISHSSLLYSLFGYLRRSG